MIVNVWEQGVRRSPEMFDVCLSPKRCHTMPYNAVVHNAWIVLLLFVVDYHNEYSRVLWHHRTVWCLFGDKQTSEFHETQVPYLNHCDWLGRLKQLALQVSFEKFGLLLPEV